MEEVKILVMALVSFLSQEQIPIVAKSAEIHIDREYQQITITQRDLFSVEPYRDLAKAGLDTLMKTRSLREDMSPLRLVSTNFYEEEGKLNAVLQLQYDDLKDLSKMSFYADEKENLSYPYITGFRYGLKTGRVDDKHIRFSAEEDVSFHMVSEEIPTEDTYSLLDDWKALTASNYEDITAYFSVKDFEKLRKFILKKGEGRSFRNIENNNPYYGFDNVGAYLSSTPKYHNHNTRLPTEEYYNLVLWGEGQFYLYLFDEYMENTNPYLGNSNVYFLKSPRLDTAVLMKYLEELKEEL